MVSIALLLSGPAEWTNGRLEKITIVGLELCAGSVRVQNKAPFIHALQWYRPAGEKMGCVPGLCDVGEKVKRGLIGPVISGHRFG
mgnify:CR=1 FL=1